MTLGNVSALGRVVISRPGKQQIVRILKLSKHCLKDIFVTKSFLWSNTHNLNKAKLDPPVLIKLSDYYFVLVFTKNLNLKFKTTLLKRKLKVNH